MKKLIVVTILLILAVGSVALAKTRYHVYRKKGSMKCEIDSRDHKAFKSARGSGWVCLGCSDYRMDAQKLFKDVGCKK